MRKRRPEPPREPMTGTWDPVAGKWRRLRAGDIPPVYVYDTERKVWHVGNVATIRCTMPTPCGHCAFCREHDEGPEWWLRGLPAARKKP